MVINRLCFTESSTNKSSKAGEAVDFFSSQLTHFSWARNRYIATWKEGTAAELVARRRAARALPTVQCVRQALL